jgi:hypothetical protein
MMQERERKRVNVSTINGKRRVRSLPGRLYSRTRGPSFRAITRNPSCLISCSHWLPDGSLSVLVGRHGAMNPAARYAATCGLNKVGQRRLQLQPSRLGVFAIFFSSRTDRRKSNWASTIQYSATFSYALLKNGSLACAARCLASSALRRQVSLSDDIRGGSANAPEPSGKCGVGQLVTTLPLPVCIVASPGRRFRVPRKVARLALRAASLVRRGHQR